MKDHSAINDPQVVKALAHPLRVRILGVLEQRAASPNEMSKDLGVNLSVVSYHVRRLRSLGLIELVRQTPRRGAIEHHYRAKPRPTISDQGWAATPDVVKGAMIGAALAQIGGAANAAAATSGFTRPDAHISRSPMQLDERGWTQAARLLARTLDQIDRIHAESAERVSKAGTHPISATAVLMLFEGTTTTDPSSGHAPRRARRRARA